MGDPIVPAAGDVTQQTSTIAQLQENGWAIVDQPAADDGSVLMSLATPQGVSHIVVMMNGDRVDARQKLGKDPMVPNPGEP
jgi:hypothetical protein